MIKHGFNFILFFLFTLTAFYGEGKKAAGRDNTLKETVNFSVTVTDKEAGVPLPSVTVVLRSKNNIIAGGATNGFGKIVFNDITSGSYLISASYIGYQEFTRTIIIDSTHKSIEIKLIEKGIELGEVEVKEQVNKSAASSIDIMSGRQVFEGDLHRYDPSARITGLIQQNLAGAVRAPTGEVHIRGQHGEFTYLIDGIPIPLGVFGGLNEIVDPKVISRVTFLTGGFPAEYGGQIAGIMDIQNRVPTGKFHLDLSSYFGSYMHSGNTQLNSNGQSISLSDHIGKIGYFISASRQETDRRIDQPVRDLFHDYGKDYFVYGKFDFLAGPDDYFTANLNYSSTNTEIPYNPAEGINLDRQFSSNSFQTLSYFKTLNNEADKEENLFIGISARQGTLEYLSDPHNQSVVYLNNDSTKSYVVDQDRSFNSLGIRVKYDKSFSHRFETAFGFNYNYSAGKENFKFHNTDGTKLNTTNSFNGYDLGFFAKFELHLFEWNRIDAGLRYDIHNAPGIGVRTLISPRIKTDFFIDESNSISLSWSKLFMPTNIENLGGIAQYLGFKASPTIPEIDDLFEIAYTRNWSFGLNSKFAFFYKYSSPGLDDQTLGSSTIRVNVNINEINVTGLEAAFTYSFSSIPLSAFLNGSIIHAYGKGPISGGFLPADFINGYFDLDHDQRLSIVFGLDYKTESLFANMTANYGSGLSNFNDEYKFSTGLFDFNTGAHTTPYWIINAAVGYSFNMGNGASIEPSFYVKNIFDNEHLIKGSFFSGASYEERRNFVFKLVYHL